MLSPFSTPSLSPLPYYSRINNHYRSSSSVKNYVLLAFNPGYALQASELNELQELFFLNSNLSQRSNALWTTSDSGRIPFWEGLIPYNPANIVVNNVASQNSKITFTVTIANSWFLWTDSESKFSHWIYNDQSLAARTKNFEMDLNDINYIGYNVTKTTTMCCQSESCGNDDETLRDNSSGDTVGAFNTCGASRISATFSNSSDDFEIKDSYDPNNQGKFRPIFKITTDSTEEIEVKFMDDQILTVSV